jgi:hypothetical protein
MHIALYSHVREALCISTTTWYTRPTDVRDGTHPIRLCWSLTYADVYAKILWEKNTVCLLKNTAEVVKTRVRAWTHAFTSREPVSQTSATPCIHHFFRSSCSCPGAVVVVATSNRADRSRAERARVPHRKSWLYLL